MFTCVLGRLVASIVLSVPKPSEGADRVGGQLRGDKECPFSDVTKSGRVWRKVPESDARSVEVLVSLGVLYVDGNVPLVLCLEGKPLSHTLSLSFRGVTKSGRVWRKVPECGARSVISTQTFRKALTASLDSCAQIKRAPSVT